MIVVTDEMIGMMGKYWAHNDTSARDVLIEIIAEIERDYIIKRRCAAQLTPELRCTLEAGVGHREHITRGPGGSKISFENLVDNSTGEG